MSVCHHIIHAWTWTTKRLTKRALWLVRIYLLAPSAEVFGNAQNWLYFHHDQDVRHQLDAGCFPPCEPASFMRFAALSLDKSDIMTFNQSNHGAIAQA